jgi:hypothetical protein
MKTFDNKIDKRTKDYKHIIDCYDSLMSEETKRVMNDLCIILPLARLRFKDLDLFHNICLN